MKDLNQWLREKANMPVCLAAGIVYGDRPPFTHFFSRAFAGTLKENVWPSLAEMTRSMGTHDLPSTHVRWMFQNALVYGSARPDGPCALIITSRNISAQDAQALEQVLAEFQTA